MKTVEPYWDGLLELYCSCAGCLDKMIVKVNKDCDSEDTFYFEIRYADKPNLWQRLRRCWQYVKGWKTLEISFDEILLNAGQAEELSKVLYRRVKAYRKKMGTYYRGTKEKGKIRIENNEDLANEIYKEGGGCL
jgi:hypothetical protein